MATTDEIMAGPCTVWIHAVDTAQPDVGTAVPAGWIKLGVQGAKNITEDGVHFFKEQTREFWRGLGSTAYQKSWMTEEAARLEFELADLTAEAVAYFMSDEPDSAPAGMTTTAAGALISGSKSNALMQGFSFNECAVLARWDDSPYSLAFASQLWLPRCQQNGNAELVSVKGAPKVLAFSYELLESASNGFGRYTAQTAVPTP